MLLTVAPTAVLTGVLTAVAVIVFTFTVRNAPVLCCCCHCAADAAADVAMLSIIHIRIHSRMLEYINVIHTRVCMHVYLHLYVCVVCISMLSGSSFLDPIPYTLAMQGCSAMP